MSIARLECLQKGNQRLACVRINQFDGLHEPGHRLAGRRGQQSSHVVIQTDWQNASLHHFGRDEGHLIDNNQVGNKASRVLNKNKSSGLEH